MNDNRIIAVIAQPYANVDVLREISAEQKCAYQSSNEQCTSSIDKKNVLKTFMKAYVSYKKRCSKFAEFPCMSCNKLCFKRECVLLERCRIPVTGNPWKLFTEYLDVHTFPDDPLKCRIHLNEGRTSSIDENNVLETFMKAYVSHKKRCSQFAEFPCMSCSKLCFKQECVLWSVAEYLSLEMHGNRLQNI